MQNNLLTGRVFPQRKQRSTALCLGGGGARGFAHVGVIKAFEECGIKFDMVVGTSVGSLVGAFYASGMNADDMAKYGADLDMKDLKSSRLPLPSNALKIGEIYSNIYGDRKIEDLPLKFYAVAVDLVEAREHIFDKGSVSVAISASSCVPLFFRPVVLGSLHLVDGGLLNNIPADVCRMLGADVVISVDVNPTRGGGTNELGIIDTLKATFSIMSAAASAQGQLNSDVCIEVDTSPFKSTSKVGYDEMIRRGYAAAMSRMEDIRKAVGYKPPVTHWWQRRKS